MRYYHKFSEVCYQVLRILATLTVLAMLVLMLIEVVRRYLFSKTFIWSDEIIRYLLIYCAFLGGSCAYYKRSLVSFDLVTGRLPEKAQAVLKLVNNTICLVFFGFLIYYAIQKVTGAAVVNSVSSASGLSMAVPYSAIPIGLSMMFIFTIDFYPELIREARDAFRGGGSPGDGVLERERGES